MIHPTDQMSTIVGKGEEGGRVGETEGWEEGRMGGWEGSIN